MADLEMLKAKYPTFKVQSLPVPTCRSCKGVGERLNKLGRWLPCLCICMGGDEELRALCADGLRTTVKKLLREMERAS